MRFTFGGSLLSITSARTEQEWKRAKEVQQIASIIHEKRLKRFRTVWLRRRGDGVGGRQGRHGRGTKSNCWRRGGAWEDKFAPAAAEQETFKAMRGEPRAGNGDRQSCRTPCQEVSHQCGVQQDPHCQWAQSRGTLVSARTKLSEIQTVLARILYLGALWEGLC